MCALFLVLLYDAASIVTAEAECVAEGSTYGAVLCLVEGEVEVVVDVFVTVIVFVVDGGRHDVVLNRETADECFYGTCGTEEVTCHTLGRRDVELVSVLTEETCDGLYL